MGAVGHDKRQGGGALEAEGWIDGWATVFSPPTPARLSPPVDPDSGVEASKSERQPREVWCPIKERCARWSVAPTET